MWYISPWIFPFLIAQTSPAHCFDHGPYATDPGEPPRDAQASEIVKSVMEKPFKERLKLRRWQKLRVITMGYLCCLFLKRWYSPNYVNFIIDSYRIDEFHEISMFFSKSADLQDTHIYVGKWIGI